MRTRSLLGLVLLVASVSLALPACANEACDLIGCSDQTVITLPSGLVSGPYDLVVMGAGETLTARCLDPGAPETMDNPAGLDCDGTGFTLFDHPLASERSVRVTVVDVETGDALVEAIEVTTVVADEFHPNGEDCPPTCYVRNGQVLLPGT